MRTRSTGSSPPPRPQRWAWLRAAARATGLLGPARWSGRPGSGSAERHERRGVPAPPDCHSGHFPGLRGHEHARATRVIRETRPHIADGLANFATRVRSCWIVAAVFGFIVAVLDVIALAIIGVPLFVTWGVLVVADYIQNIGFILGVDIHGPHRSARRRSGKRGRGSGRLHGHRRGGSDHHSATVHWGRGQVSAPQLPLFR